MELSKSYTELSAENEELRSKLEEATDTIEAIRSGQVDALIVKGNGGHQLYTLKTADQTYRVFIEKMNEGAVTLNRDGIILYSNSKFAEMAGMSLEKVMGLPFEKFVDENIKEKYKELISKGWEQDCKEEVSLINKEAKQIPCLMSCTILDLDEGPALSLILTDLSIQKESQRQLKLKNDELEVAQNETIKLNDELEDTVKLRTNDLLISREHFKVLSNNIPQLSWTNLPNGEVNFFNQQWYDYTALTFSEIREWGWQDVVHPDDLQNTTEKYVAALTSGNIFEVENRYRRHDGVYRWHLNRANPVRNETEEIIFWVGTATDIEDQKLELERKDEFIGIASHELKTPLTSLKGYLQLIMNYRKEELPPVIKQYAEKANGALNKLQRLVNDLLDVSKIQAGRLEYKLSTINLSELVEQGIENATHIYPEYSFNNVDGAGYLVYGNAERLEQVLGNFLSNAVKYSYDDKRVIISTKRLKECVRVSVTDFGIGLPEGQTEKIFERFYRVGDTQYMTSGLGMGLYICAEIIKNHNGKIGVDSVFGKGSTFYFDLPLIDVVT